MRFVADMPGALSVNRVVQFALHRDTSHGRPREGHTLARIEALLLAPLVVVVPTCSVVTVGRFFHLFQIDLVLGILGFLSLVFRVPPSSLFVPLSMCCSWFSFGSSYYSRRISWVMIKRFSSMFGYYLRRVQEY